MGTTAAAGPGVPGRASAIAEGGLPWSTRPASITAVDTHAADIGIPDILPSRIVVRADEPFERFDPDDLRLLGEWLERSHWTAGPGAAACVASRTGTASVLTCGRP